MERYNAPEQFADAGPKEAPHEMIVFSNGTPRTLETLIGRADALGRSSR